MTNSRHPNTSASPVGALVAQSSAGLAPQTIRAISVRMDELLVWYDGGCPLCKREIAFMRKLDRRGAITFVDVTREAGNCPIDPAERLARFHARENGRVLSGAAAFAAMWRAIPWLKPLGIAARNRFVLAGLERLYRSFLRIRPSLQNAVRRMEAKKPTATPTLPLQ